MKRLLYVVPDFYPNTSGYANACVNFIYGIASPELDIHILSFQPISLPRSQVGISLHIIISTSPSALTCAIDSELAGRWDAVIFETFENADIQNYLLDRLDVNSGSVVVRIHAATETELYVSRRSDYYDKQFMEAKRLARRIQNIWSTTDYYLNFFKEHYCDSLLSAYEKKYAKVPNFNSVLGADLLVPSPKVSNLVATLKGQTIMLAMGRMSWQGIHQKNFINLVDAAYISRDSLSTCHIFLIGDGPYRSHLKNRILALGLESVITLIPHLDHIDVRWLMGQVHAGILISKYEGHSMFCAECQEQGVPLLYSANTALDEVVLDEVSGIRVFPDDVMSLAEGLKKLLRFTPKREEVSRAYKKQCNLEGLAVRTRALIELLTVPLQKPKACVFGTGNYYTSVREIIRFSYHIQFFADNNSHLHGKIFDGAIIVPPQQINILDIDIIIIASGFYKEIRQQLVNMGLESHKIFLVQKDDIFNNPFIDI
ncbi:glycosyltransferase family 4 protein [Aeromonas hydrophila]|uniref:glycosyltransferase family 4 protein n=1 Tax=Aeromonas hydrophila TaxID=644 RepID=UPI003305F45F